MTAATKPRLRRCPFCNGRIWMGGPQEVTYICGSYHTYYVACLCGARGPEKDTPKEAISAWNRRARREK